MTISFDKIQAALNKEDIEGLLELGAPDDEYSSEAEEIFSALAALKGDQLNEQNITTIIARIWEKAFDRSHSEIEKRIPAFQRIAGYLLI